MSEIADRISYILETEGIKQTAFAAALGLSRSYVSQLCNGDREPSSRTITDICRVYKVNEVWLRTGVGEPHTPVDRSQELASLVADLLSDSPDSTRARLISVMLRYDPNGPEWAVVERIIQDLVAEFTEAEKNTGEP